VPRGRGRKGARPATHALAQTRRVGWPKRKRCLVCGRVRLSTGPRDRLHPDCRHRVNETAGYLGER